MKKYVMAIDQGTTGTTVSILNHSGQILGKSNTEFRQIFPQPGWVEHDPEDIWNSVEQSVVEALAQSRVSKSDIACIGITNQRETVVVWNKKTGKPVHNAIVWQCRRTQDFCLKLKKEKKDKIIYKKTGLVTDPYFSASKVRWILNKDKNIAVQAKKGELLMGTIDTYLLWRLTDGESHKTDVSNASRTMLMNIHTGLWDNELLKVFGVYESMLPVICDSSGVFGETKGLSFLPNGIAISGIAGDQQAALFGQVCFQQGEAKCTFGTGSFLLMNTGNKAISSKAGMLTTVAWRLPKQKMTYAIEGGAFICGAAVQWLRDGLNIISKSSEVEILAKKVESSEGVEFIPALTGLGAPYWWSEARGIITGLTRGSTKHHIARATLEAMALQNVDILEAMQKDLGKKIKNLKVDGGASANNLLMQLQSDYMGANVTRPMLVETTSIGAAYLAGLGIGFWSSLDELKKVWQKDLEFKPQIDTQKRKKRLSNWHDSVKRSKPVHIK